MLDACDPREVGCWWSDAAATSGMGDKIMQIWKLIVSTCNEEKKLFITILDKFFLIHNRASQLKESITGFTRRILTSCSFLWRVNIMLIGPLRTWQYHTEKFHRLINYATRSRVSIFFRLWINACARPHLRILINKLVNKLENNFISAHSLLRTHLLIFTPRYHVVLGCGPYFVSFNSCYFILSHVDFTPHIISLCTNLFLTLEVDVSWPSVNLLSVVWYEVVGSDERNLVT